MKTLADQAHRLDPPNTKHNLHLSIFCGTFSIKMVRAAEAIPVVFWRSAGGTEPVREWLQELPQVDRRVVGYNLRILQIGWPVGMPLSRSLGNGLWELRSTLPSQRIARVVFCFHNHALVLLHGFIKKTQKIPPADLELAQKRKRSLPS